MTHTRLQWRGAGTALVTPFDPHGEVDVDCFVRLLERQLEAGVHLLVVAGTTGESATLRAAERELLVRTAVEVTRGRAAVIAGGGGNDTRAAIADARRAGRCGADAALTVVPPYNRPPQDALIAHFTAIADASPIPIALYDVPARTSCALGLDATLTLAEHPNIVAIKTAPRSFHDAVDLLAQRPPALEVWSGEDAWALAMLLLGAGGTISVVGNVAPHALVRLVAHARAGDSAAARGLHQSLLPLIRAQALEVNPIPVKAAMAMLDLASNTLRPPLRPLVAPHHAALRAALSALEPAEVATAEAR